MKTPFKLQGSTLKKQQMWRFSAGGIECALVSILLCSCQSVTYDVRQIQQPIVLNNNPFLAPANASSLGLTNVDTYTAMVSESDVTASSGNGYATTTVTTHAAANQAQVNAFDKIGGQQNRVIRNISLDTDYLAVNALFALAEKVSINASGDIAEFRYPAVAVSLPTTNSVVLAGDTSPLAVSNSVVELNPVITTNNFRIVTNEIMSAPTPSSKGTNP